jgi:four helix bundle protein
MTRFPDAGEEIGVMGESDGFRLLQAAREFAEQVAIMTRGLPSRAPAKLRGQLADSAGSVSRNIAEGNGRGTTPDEIRFFRYACGSLEEAQNDLRVCVNTSLIDRRTFYRLWNRSVTIRKMLIALIEKRECE